ncbi:MAG TPA: methyltransferase domain-containing protein [Thermoleophilaceae bacterium]|nr:methyltransferase domain-containing protein [Thermoleophilaceae bacterium]
MDPKTMWDSGDFAAVAERITESGELVVQRAGVVPGMRVLDVACGTGNVSIPAAKAGAQVTGLDFAAGLLDIARERAADAMVEIDWVEGDAQALPFDADYQPKPAWQALENEVRAPA